MSLVKTNDPGNVLSLHVSTLHWVFSVIGITNKNSFYYKLDRNVSSLFLYSTSIISLIRFRQVVIGNMTYVISTGNLSDDTFRSDSCEGKIAKKIESDDFRTSLVQGFVTK